MPIVTDSTLLDESAHFDRVYEGEKRQHSVDVDPYIGLKLTSKSRNIFERIIKQEWPDYAKRRIRIGEIACGDGSAYWYLGRIPFESVHYIGTDISLKSLQFGVKKRLPPNWDSLFVRTSANAPLFMNNSVDIAVSLAALHHLELRKVIDWVAKSLRPEGLFIIQEPSQGNPFAKLGRKFIKEFNTKGERPLNPREVKELAVESGLESVYECGINFITGPLAFLVGMKKIALPVKQGLYYIASTADLAVRNQALSYSFIHIYKKRK
jgi:SAM-dependent methyltransferase